MRDDLGVRESALNTTPTETADLVALGYDWSGRSMVAAHGVMLVEEPWLYELTKLDHQLFRQVVQPNPPLGSVLEFAR